MSRRCIHAFVGVPLFAALLPLLPALQAATQAGRCAEDELPGRFTGAPLRLCVAGEGEQRHYVLSIAGVERLQADIASVRSGAVADWAGHALGLQCSEDGLTCEIRVDERDAWKGQLPEHLGVPVVD